jgi:hypothetical protein
MKTATIPAIRVEPAFRKELEESLDAGETLTEFVEASIRSTVAWRRTQDEFLARAHASAERALREGGGIAPDELMKRMRGKLVEARKTAARKSRGGR